jgi:pimeloyl-ACP methyl ester carboxylesterase
MSPMQIEKQTVQSEFLYYFEAGSGSPLLLIHGLMMTGEMFRPVIEHFSFSHRVIVPDLRGHGQSRILPPPYAIGQLAADLARLLDHLDIETISVLGYSNGGAVAQQFALDFPKRCNRLVLACTYAFNMATFREWIEGHIFSFFIRIFGLKWFANLGKSKLKKQLSEEQAVWFANIISNQDLKLMSLAWRQMMKFDSRQRLAEIKCPTLIIAGSNDDAVPIHHAKMLHKGIIGSQLTIIDGADHLLMWTFPDKFLRAADQFLNLEK